MSDNTILNLGSGGDTIASDDIGGIKFQRTKMTIGADGVNDGDISSTNPLPTYILGAASATLANVASSASSVTVLASSAARKGACFFNDVDKACYLKFGSTASATSFTVKVDAGGFYNVQMPVYTGVIDAIWDASPTGSMRVTSW